MITTEMLAPCGPLDKGSYRIDGATVQWWGRRGQAHAGAKAIGWPVKSVVRVHTRFGCGYALLGTFGGIVTKKGYAAVLAGETIDAPTIGSEETLAPSLASVMASYRIEEKGAHYVIDLASGEAVSPPLATRGEALSLRFQIASLPKLERDLLRAGKRAAPGCEFLIGATR